MGMESNKGDIGNEKKQNIDTNVDDIVDDEDIGEDRIKLKHWLESFNCGQYLEILVKEGYDTLQFVKHIEKIEDLNDIGIVKKGHQKILMKEIDKLRKEIGTDEEREEGIAENGHTGSQEVD